MKSKSIKIYSALAPLDEEYRIQKHTLEDLHILKLELSQREGEKAILKLQVPQDDTLPGLLVGKKVFVSCDLGEGILRLLFTGVWQEEVRQDSEKLSDLTFVAYHPHAEVEESILIKSLQNQESWDPLFVQHTGQPSLQSVIAGSSSCVHWNRLTGALELTSYKTGPMYDRQEPPIIEGTFKKQSPSKEFSAFDVEVRASWMQSASGIIDIAPSVVHAFGQGINSYSSSLPNVWARSGTFLSGAQYYVTESHLYSCQPPKTGGLGLYGKSSAYMPLDKEEQPTSDALDFDAEQNRVAFKRYWYKGVLNLMWSYKQPRRERVQISINLPGHQKSAKTKKLLFDLKTLHNGHETASWRPGVFYHSRTRVHHDGSDYVCQDAHVSGASFDKNVWTQKKFSVSRLDEASQASFFTTNRGRKALGIALDRVQRWLDLTIRRRTVSFKTPIAAVWDLTCAHRVQIADPLRSGETIEGKVIGYTFTMNGQTGEYLAQVDLGVFSEEGKNAPKEALEYKSPAGITFAIKQEEQPSGIINPHTLTRQELVEWVQIHNRPEEQERFLESSAPLQEKLAYLENKGATTLQVHLKNLGSQGVLDHRLTAQATLSTT